MEGNCLEVFLNPLIWETLGSFVSFKDFQSLRLVNSHIKTGVEGSEGFKNRTSFTVKKNYGDDMSCYFDCANPVVTYNLKIVFTIEKPSPGVSSRRQLSELLSNKKSIKMTKFVTDADSMSNTTITPQQFFGLMHMTPKIQEISMHIRIWSGMNFNTSPTSDLDTLAKIKAIVLFSPQTMKNQSPFNATEGSNFQNNLKILAEKSSNLNCISCDNLKINTYSGVSDAALGKQIADFVIKNSQTLVKLQISFGTFWENNLFVAEFPKLKELIFRSSYSCKENISQFMEKLGPLKVLRMTWVDMLPRRVYDIVAQSPQKLIQLHVKAKKFGPNEEAGDWTFLSGCQDLKDFQIKSPHNSLRNAALAQYHVLMRQLPSTIYQIYLRGLPGVGPLNVLDWNFPNLASLSILRCEDALDDANLQKMFTYKERFQKLKQLDISHCPISNLGLVGIIRSGTTYRQTQLNISSCLPGLERLTIKYCPEITDVALKRLYLPNLNYIDVSSNQKLQRSAIAQLAVQNPNLRTLRSSWRLGMEMRKFQQMGNIKHHVRLLYVDDKSGQDSESEAEFVMRFRNNFYDSD